MNAINGTWTQATPITHTQPSSPDLRLLDSLPFRSTVELEAHKTAPGYARRWLVALLTEWSLAEFRDAAELVLSELVTNSVAEIGKVAWPAARPRLRLWLRGGPSHLALQVWDPILAIPVPREAADDEENGRGLLLVRQYSASWGFYHTEQFDGKITWAMIAAAQGEMLSMASARCLCGFAELDDEEIADHLAVVFTPDDSIGNDGKLHEELPMLACSCGFAAITPDELEGHLMKAFTPADGIGLDGNCHGARDTPAFS